MPWTPLIDRWNELPLILAEPILRRVESESVTVRLATKEWRRVTLEVCDPIFDTVLTGERSARSLGPGCHFVVVTARPSEAHAGPLRPGQAFRAPDVPVSISGTNQLRVSEAATTGPIETLQPHTIFTVSLAFDDVERPLQ